MELDGSSKFLFYTMMQAAIRMHDLGKTGEEFINFAKGIWETLEMNDKEKLSSILQASMLKDMKSFVDETK